MSEITDRIKTAGYWHVSIHPAVFVEKRVGNLLDLHPILRKCAVGVRGWDFPHIDRDDPTPPQLDFIQQEHEWEHHAERWRFYQSGQFTMLRAMPYDWRDRSGWWPADGRWKRGSSLGVGDSLLTFYEIFELAARLSNSPAGDVNMRINLEVGGLKDRALVIDDPRRSEFSINSTAGIAVLPLSWTFSRTALLADVSELVIGAVPELFTRFGRQMTADLLRDWLQKILKS
jgi:hypothetical protein